MAVLSLVANSYPHNDEVTLSGTPNTMQEISVPGNARRIEMVFETNAGQLLTAGTDATVITTEKAWPIPADSAWFYDFPRSKGTHSIFVASSVASTVVKFIVTDGD
jgi:hypothetical protein